MTRSLLLTAPALLLPSAAVRLGRPRLLLGFGALPETAPIETDRSATALPGQRNEGMDDLPCLEVLGYGPAV